MITILGFVLLLGTKHGKGGMWLGLIVGTLISIGAAFFADTQVFSSKTVRYTYAERIPNTSPTGVPRTQFTFYAPNEEPLVITSDKLKSQPSTDGSLNIVTDWWCGTPSSYLWGLAVPTYSRTLVYPENAKKWYVEWWIKD